MRTSKGAIARDIKNSERLSGRYIPSVGKPNKYSPYYQDELNVRDIRRYWKQLVKTIGIREASIQVARYSNVY